MAKFQHFERVIPDGYKFASMQAYASKEAALLGIEIVRKNNPGKTVEPLRGEDLYWYLVYKAE